MIESISELFVLHNFLFLWEGLKTTLFIGLMTILISGVTGIVLGVISSSEFTLGRRLVALYVDFFRNIPVLLVVLAVRFLSPFPPVWAGIVALSLYTTAIVSEVVRAGIKSIPKAQYEASYSQGFTTVQIMQYVILPQALRNVLPPLVSQSITVIKDTSFVWTVGITELTGAGMIILGRYYQTAQVVVMFAMLAATYFIVNFTISNLARRIKRPGE